MKNNYPFRYNGPMFGNETAIRYIRMFIKGLIKSSCIVLLLVLSMFSNLEASALDPANLNANSNAKLILNYYASLTGRSDHRLISGQFIGYNGTVNNYDLIPTIYNKTGKWVGIVCSDYVDWSNGQTVKYNLTNPNLIKAWNDGSLVTLQVHMTNPANPNGGGLNDVGVDLNQLLVAGTTTYTRWFAELDTIAKGLAQLQDNGVVVLFRPFHEMNGDWFWWGGKTPSLFIQVWKQMFNYFTNTKKLNNLIWVFAPGAGSNASSYYPGDGYVDITGLDAYTSTITTSEITGYSAMVSLGKPFGFTEFGPEGATNPSGTFDYRIFINGVKANFPAACFFICWNENWGLSSNYYVTEAISDPYVANRDNLSWKQTPTAILTENNSVVKDILIYPNPLENGKNLKIRMNSLDVGNEIKVSIYDLTGKVMAKETLFYGYDGIYEINSSPILQKGVYLVNIESYSGSNNSKLVVR